MRVVHLNAGPSRGMKVESDDGWVRALDDWVRGVVSVPRGGLSH